MSTRAEARRDAKEYARARMFFGPGAGNRRKLIQTRVDAKVLKSPMYASAFLDALADQDMEDHADKAEKERKKADRNESVRRNSRAILTGNHKNAQTGVLLLILAGTVAHRTGYDKVMYEKGKILYYDTKDRIKRRFQKTEPKPFRIVND